jgi:predicted DNA-binding transcriptional regulator YafY
MLSVEMTDETFEMPEDFSPEAYFAEYYGVLTDETPMAHVVVRAYGRTSNYLRTLPLHPSQREVTSTEDYTDFCFDIRPTADFIGELLSYDVGLEVLQPADLRERIKRLLEQSLKHYS